MPEDVATLADALVEKQADLPLDAPVETKEEPVVAAVVDNEAAEIGNILLQSGYTKERINELIEAPGALSALRYAVQNNPQEFLNMLERTDPQTGAKFLETMADTYVQRFGDRAKPAKTGKEDANADLMAEIKALREKTDRLENEQGRRDAAAALASTQQRYDARVEDLFGQMKDLSLTPSESKAMRARLNSELAADPTAVQRTSKGNFVDVAPTFKRIVDEWANDKRTQAENEKQTREKQQKSAFSEFQNGPNFTAEVPSATFDSWDATEDGFAKALAGTGK